MRSDYETLIVFTRYPRAGRTKTRLISCLGTDGAAQLQREMTEHTLGRIWPLVKRRGLNLEVRFEDASKADMRRWLGSGIRFVPQGNGDLGARMHRAMSEAFLAGAQKVVIVGADCPDLNSSLLAGAFDALQDRQVVFGPARDGGYYLVGSRQPAPFLFNDIAWGTDNVLARSVARARVASVEPCFLAEMSDVDEPADLPVWENSRRASRSISIIIPTLNEAQHLPGTLRHLQAIQPTEIIVADAGSRDDTPRIAETHGATVVSCCTPNRARQMNAGAVMARGEALLFLHADTRLPPNFCQEVFAAFRSPTIVGGAFRFAIADPFPGRWLIQSAVNLRSRLFQLPYGDQALFVRRWVFDKIGGFPDLPIMEDYEFVRRVRRLGRLALLEAAALTSGRRWQRLGCLRVTLVNTLVILGYHCGVSPARLATFYRSQATPLNPRLETSEDLAHSISNQ